MALHIVMGKLTIKSWQNEMNEFELIGYPYPYFNNFYIYITHTHTMDCNLICIRNKRINFSLSGLFIDHNEMSVIELRLTFCTRQLKFYYFANKLLMIDC